MKDFKELMESMEAMTFIVDTMPKAAVMAVHIKLAEMSLEEWWDKNMTCTCGECDIERFEPLWDIYKGMIRLFLDDKKPNPAQIDEWVKSVIRLRRETEGLRMAIEHLKGTSAN